MVAPRALWLDCCGTPQRRGLFRTVERHMDAHYASWPTAIGAAVRACQPAFACVEYDYPDQGRLRAIPLLRRDAPDLPVLMLTEYHSEALAVWSFRHRVWDYRIKPITEEALFRVLDVLADLASSGPQHGWFEGTLPPDLIAPSGHLRKPVVAAPRTAPAIAFVSEHYGDVIRLETVARLCHLSESEFSRNFHHEHGVSFRRFLLNYRIAMARDFLAEPCASVSEVAYSVGFNDLSHFGRMFRRTVGEPATRYHQRVSPTGHGPDGANPCDAQEAPT